ncbi:MAG: cysteine peptidase family C39 domain-containing protein [Planctomycetota bacterium]
MLSGMDEVNWFGLLAMLSVLGWQVGVRLGERGVASARATVLVTATAMVVLTYLVKHPSVGVQVLPLGLLARVEGVAAVPMFAGIMGVAWSRSRLRRQRVVVGWAILLGAVHFVNGGMWMLQATPSEVMATDRSGADVLQSQEYTCVPAAAASALRRLGIDASEAEMAKLTRTRPGTGSTTVRALYGINLKLEQAQSVWRAHLVEIEASELQGMPMPLLTPLRFESTRRHMVMVFGLTARGVRVADPVDGQLIFQHDEFAGYFTGEAIVFMAEE